MMQVVQSIKKLAKGREITLYGASGMADALCEMLETCDVSVAFFVDKDYRIFHTLLRPVKPPEELDPLKYFPVVVPFGVKAIGSITALLSELGYAREDCFVWTWDVDYDIVFNGIVLGKHFQLSKALTRYNAKRYIKSVGRYTSIEHSFCYATDHCFGLSTSGMVPSAINNIPHNRLEIGADVWIGANVFVNCSKVKSIGCGAVIASGAVVIDDVPDYAVVAGVPAKVKKYRFSPMEIETLLAVQWWNWSDAKIIDNADCFRDYGVFFERFGN